MKVVKFGCPGKSDPQPIYCDVPDAVPGGRQPCPLPAHARDRCSNERCMGGAWASMQTRWRAMMRAMTVRCSAIFLCSDCEGGGTPP